MGFQCNHHSIPDPGSGPTAVLSIREMGFALTRLGNYCESEGSEIVIKR